METEIHIVINNRLTCKQTFLNSFKQEMLFIAPAVPQDALLTNEELCGPDFWDPLSKWEKTLAGMCMVYLVACGDVPFELVPRKGRNPYSLQFRIKV
jgi:hypothetical protein